MGTSAEPNLQVLNERQIHRNKWIKGAFIVQSILLISMIVMMSVLSYRFNAQYMIQVKQNIENAKNLREQQKLLDQEQKAFVDQELSIAVEWRTLGKDDRADAAIANALRADPGSWETWRVKSKVMIKKNNAQQALNEMEKAPIDKQDIYNMVTKAMLECALHQNATAEQLKSDTSLSRRLSKIDRDDLDSACH